MFDSFIKIYDNPFAALLDLLLPRSWQLQIPLEVMALKAHKRLYLCCFICLMCSYYDLSSVWGWRNLDPRNGLEKLAWALCQLQKKDIFLNVLKYLCQNRTRKWLNLPLNCPGFCFLLLKKAALLIVLDYCLFYLSWYLKVLKQC